MPSLPRLLFCLTVALATVLLALVGLAPFVEPVAALPGGAGRTLALFAHDPFLRRTTVASAIGLYTTAWVFFRPGARAARRPRPPAPPANIVGA